MPVSSSDQALYKIHTLRAILSIFLVGFASNASASELLSNLLLLTSTANAATKSTPPTVSKGSLNYVICSDDGARVRDTSNVNTIMYRTTAWENVKAFQGWGENKKVATLNGEKTTLVRIQLENKAGRSKTVGWIGEQFVKLRSECPRATAVAQAKNQRLSLNGTQISGLNDSRCCLFPIKHSPLMSYTTGERKFGAGRSGSRVHAASDLYGRLNEPIRAVAAGKVVRGLYDFYLRTYAIDIKHQSGFVVRYGEISGRRTPVSDTGSLLKMGQTVGYMGQLIPRVRPPMLHFELYSGKLSGHLLSVQTTKTNKFGRRKDLIDPTRHLQRWEQKSF